MARPRELAFYLSVLGTISYLPVSGIIFLNATVAEHWLYLLSVSFPRPLPDSLNARSTSRGDCASKERVVGWRHV
jgi:hypothetical protein